MNMKNNFALDDFLPYLLNRAGVRLGLAYGSHIAQSGITLPMWRVMAALWENDDQRLSELAERTSIDISTLSRILNRLQRKRFIVRQRSGTDGRALSVRLTKFGCATTKRLIAVATHYEQVAVDGINPRELASLKRHLNTLFANIAQLEKEFSRSQKTARRKSA
jgi:DNA-binding MarR family transcriptional regulator